MKSKSFKYILLMVVFIIGIALGSISSDDKKIESQIENFENELLENEFYLGEDKYSNEDVSNNLFIKIAKFLEDAIKAVFKKGLDILAQGLKLVFGI